MKRLCLIITIIFAFGMIPLGLSLAGIIDCDYTSDFLRQQLPFIYEFKRMLASGTPCWSWNTFLGDNFIAEYSYYGILSPFNWFCCLFPEKYIALAFFISVYLRMLCTGLFAYLYFKRMNVSEHSAILGGILYTFSSFCIINLIYIMFYEAIMLFPLLLIGIENSIDKKKYSFAVLALLTFLVTVEQYYCGVSSIICGSIYLFCRVIFTRKYRSTRNFITPLSAIIFGIIMSSFILIPTAIHIMGSNRGATVQTMGLNNIILSALGHIFWAFVPKVTEGMPSSFMYGTSGSISLFIQVFGVTYAAIYSFIKRDWLAICICIFTLSYLTPLNGVFSFFTSTFYCRWGYCFILLIIFATIKCIDEKKYTHKYINTCIVITILYIISFILLCQYFLWKAGRPTGLNIREVVELSLSIFNLASLYWISKSPDRLRHYSIPMTSIASGINLFIAVCFLSGSPNNLLKHSQNPSGMLTECVINNPVPYNTSTPSFRTDFIRPDFLNNAQLKNAPSITCYHSLFNKNIIDFAEYINNEYILAYTVIRTPRESLSALLSVKDVIHFDWASYEYSDYNFGLTFKEKLGRHDKYSFDYYIPMGMVYDSYVTRSQLDSLRNADKEADLCLMMLDNIIIEDCDEAEIEKVLRKSAINTDITLDSITALRRQHTTDFKGTSKGYTITTRPDAPKGMVFISTPCDDGFTATIDGEPTKIYHANMGMSGIMVPAGKHTIEATYLAPGLKLGAIISGVMMAMLLIYTIISYRRYKCQRDTRDGSSSH